MREGTVYIRSGKSLTNKFVCPENY